MEASDRTLFLSLAWFPPDSLLLDQPTRPLSLLSLEAMRLMGLMPLMEGPTDLTSTDETRLLAAYLWLHTEPIEVIERALWDGSYRAVLDSQTDPAPSLIAEWLMVRERLRVLIEACTVEIIPKPKGEHDDTPGRVVGPSTLAFQLSTLARCTGQSIRSIGWELPLPQALQLYHAELRWHGIWTAQPGQPVAAAEFSDFTIGALTT